DTQSNVCRYFYYSGCQGNTNNFATELECINTCKRGVTTKRAPQASLCPDDHSPLGGYAPVLCGNGSESIACPKGWYCHSGVQDVCCPSGPTNNYGQKLPGGKDENDVRFSPRTPQSKTANQKSRSFNDITTTTEKTTTTFVMPRNMCPDGSDSLININSGQPHSCGTTFDGRPLCPSGYYCSIDIERDVRLCCPLRIRGIKIPPPPVLPPYFGHRSANPGEVIPRGSLPADELTTQAHFGLKPLTSKLTNELIGLSQDALSPQVMDKDQPTLPRKIDSTERNIIHHVEELEVVQSNQSSSAPYAHMMLKPAGKNYWSSRQSMPSSISSVDNADPSDGLQIDISETFDPFETIKETPKVIRDRSICHLRASEGRQCREDEIPSSSNLQYFYSKRDNRCKMYFYRGCGGTLNRFSSKKQCELLCMGS
ncbi:hypothetical protein AB6A40_008968, partial [Gnathostoma spinigerum]